MFAALAALSMSEGHSIGPLPACQTRIAEEFRAAGQLLTSIALAFIFNMHFGGKQRTFIILSLSMRRLL